MITKYRLIEGKNHANFEKSVQAAIDEGWTPMGDPFVRDASGFFYQAVVKLEKYAESISLPKTFAADNMLITPEVKEMLEAL